MEKYKVINDGLSLFEVEKEHQPSYIEGDILLYSPDGGEYNSAMIWKEDGTDAHDIAVGDIEKFVARGFLMKIEDL